MLYLYLPHLAISTRVLVLALHHVDRGLVHHLHPPLHRLTYSVLRLKAVSIVSVLGPCVRRPQNGDRCGGGSDNLDLPGNAGLGLEHIGLGDRVVGLRLCWSSLPVNWGAKVGVQGLGYNWGLSGE